MESVEKNLKIFNLTRCLNAPKRTVLSKVSIFAMHIDFVLPSDTTWYPVVNNSQTITVNILIHKASHTPLAYFYRSETRKKNTPFGESSVSIPKSKI